MALPDAIPKKEPQIEVGIVLPEDKTTAIEIRLPQDARYSLHAHGQKSIKLEHDSTLQFRQKGSAIEAALPDGSRASAPTFELAPMSELQPRAGYGVLVHNVVAGRNFHWQKKIDVALPGGLLVRMHDNALILINRLPFEQYIMCVATSEMSASCPNAFLEAQTITARSWMLANVEKKHRALGMDVCNDDCCQRYQGSTFLSAQAIAATSATAGKVLMYDGEICDARYSKSCGGMMEAFEAVWPGEPHPYLQVKPDVPAEAIKNVPDLTTESAFRAWLTEPSPAYCSPHFIAENRLKSYLGSVDESSRYFRWTFSLTQRQITELLNDKLDLHASQIHALRVLERGGSGRVVKLKIAYADRESRQKSIVLNSEYAVRAALHPKFLYSSAFVVDNVPESAHVPRTFQLKGCGWGHGVGLCQIGGLGMALAGKSAKDILAHYYPGARVKKIYE